MLIITSSDYQPADFKLLSQNMQTYEICGYSDSKDFTTVNDIPSGFSQRVLPPEYGEFLTLSQIENGLLLESGEIERLRNENESLKSQLTDTQLALCELYEGVFANGKNIC